MGDERPVKRSAQVVEDGPVLRLLLVEALASEGWEVVEASNGYTGVRLAEQSRPDIIVLDLALPEMSGLEVVEALRGNRLTAQIPVVVASAYPEWLAHGDVGAVEDVIVKPFELEDLFGRVERAASRRHRLLPTPVPPVVSGAPAPSVAVPHAAPRRSIQGKTSIVRE